MKYVAPYKVHSNSGSNQRGNGINGSEYKGQHCRYCKNDKEGIILFKKRFSGLVAGSVVVGMQKPSKTMHHIFVSKPCNKLHKEVAPEKDKNKHQSYRFRKPALYLRYDLNNNHIFKLLFTLILDCMIFSGFFRLMDFQQLFIVYIGHIYSQPGGIG